jgi:hypothetical protein
MPCCSPRLALGSGLATEPTWPSSAPPWHAVQTARVLDRLQAHGAVPATFFLWAERLALQVAGRRARWPTRAWRFPCADAATVSSR